VSTNTFVKLNAVACAVSINTLVQLSTYIFLLLKKTHAIMSERNEMFEMGCIVFMSNAVLTIVVHDQNLYTNYTSGALRLWGMDSHKK